MQDCNCKKKLIRAHTKFSKLRKEKTVATEVSDYDSDFTESETTEEQAAPAAGTPAEGGGGREEQTHLSLNLNVVM